MMSRIAASAAVVLSLCLVFSAPVVQGQATVYASGCAGAQPAPTVSHTGMLMPGYPQTVRLHGATPHAVTVLFIGTINTTPQGDPLAIPLDGISGVNPGCTLNTSLTFSLVSQADASGEDSLSFALPTGLGPNLNFQWAVWESLDPLSIVMSEALNIFIPLTAKPSVDPLVFGAVRVGESSPAEVLSLSNAGLLPLTVSGATIYDSNASDFAETFVLPAPITLAPGASTDVEVTFAPAGVGPRVAKMQINHSGLPGSFPDPEIDLRGVGIGPLGQEILLTAGTATGYLDGSFQFWVQDYGFTGGLNRVTTSPIGGTVDEALYQTQRRGNLFFYALGVPSGTYDVTLHFSEAVHSNVGLRVFDVEIERNLVIDDLDVFAEVGKNHAYTETHTVLVDDGTLDMTFTGVVDTAVLCAVEVRRKFAVLEVDPIAVDFGFVDQETDASIPVEFMNTGNQPLAFSGISFLVNEGQAHDLVLELDGVDYQGDHEDVTVPSSFVLAGGASLVGQLTFAPTEHVVIDVDIVFSGDFDERVLNVQGAGGVGGHPFLHVVIEPIPTAVDYDGDGFEDVSLDGSLSHTHEFGQQLVNFVWSEGQDVLSAGPTPTVNFALGPHTVCLTIEDDNEPPESLQGCADLQVVTPVAVPGVLAHYTDAAPGSAHSFLDAAQPLPDYAEVIGTFHVAEGVGTGSGVGTSDLGANTYVRLRGSVDVTDPDIYEFFLFGGADSRLFVNGLAYTGPVALGVGPTTIEARYAVDALGELPVSVTYGHLGGPYGEIAAGAVVHDQTLDPPVINSMPSEGSTAGGNSIVISGLGFFPYDSVLVHWGATTLDESDFTSIQAGSISFDSPPHAAGEILVTVETPLGTSNARPFLYSLDGPPPITFTLANLGNLVLDPTCAAWGPDGRLWVGTLKGELTAFTFDQDYNVLNQTKYDGVKNLPENDILGIAFDPFDPPGTTRVYVAHSLLFAQGGSTFVGPAPYPGFISVLTGPSYNVPEVIASGLPASNHDHGVNGMVFDHSGDLLVSIGGNTNAGVKYPNIGDLPESPLSGSIVRLKTSRPDFDGTFTYVETLSGLPNDDQVFGEMVDVAPGPTYEIVSRGVRNVLDLVLTTKGLLYGVDNGPNNGYGYGSTGLTTDNGVHSAWPDELNVFEYDRYYGHPNRSRGRYEPRENQFYNLTAPGVPGVFTQRMLQVSSSTNGIDEYRATTFQSQLRGDLIVQRWDNNASFVKLSADGRSATSFTDIVPQHKALIVRAGPGGVIIGVDYSADRLKILRPVDASATGLTAYDIFPWRAPASGGAAFVIGGENFASLGETSVTIGGIPATLTSVTSRRIKGTIPFQPTPTTDLLDVAITSGPSSVTIEAAFRYLYDPGNEPGTWDASLPDMPLAVSENGTSVIGTKIYVVGGNTAKTLVYDTVAGTWSQNDAAQRPFPGDHHSVQTWNGKMYVIGGTGNGADGKVQIYDPVANSWSLGADMPWDGGSVNTALIGDLIYAAGGFDAGAFTTTECAVYDPAIDQWTAGLAPMVNGRNHAAAGTDGSRLWVFGGRGPGSGDTNVVANGFADVQVYDPVANTWDSSLLPGSQLVPMPIGRGGTSRAVMYHGEFYVMGGETLTGPGAQPGFVYDRVDVYDPTTHTWRLDAPMTTPRHGADPVKFDGKLWLLGGGFAKGHAPTAATEVFKRF